MDPHSPLYFAMDPYEHRVSALSMTPSAYLIARTDVPVTMGDLVCWREESLEVVWAGRWELEGLMEEVGSFSPKRGVGAWDNAPKVLIGSVAARGIRILKVTRREKKKMVSDRWTCVSN